MPGKKNFPTLALLVFAYWASGCSHSGLLGLGMRAPASTDPAMIVRVGTHIMPLYPDSDDLESNGVSSSIYQSSSECRSLESGSRFRNLKVGDCTEINHFIQDQLEDSTKFCESEVIKVPGHAFKVVQVLDRCLLSSGIESKRFSWLTQVPLVRIKDESGKIWVTDYVALKPFVEMNRTKTMIESAECKSVLPVAGYRSAEQCAVKKSRELALKACEQLGGKAAQDSFKIQVAPYMCYTEAFEEEFCAASEMKCDF